MMNVAFMHYHLRPGGVTTVIRQQLRVLKGVCETLMISGEAAPSDFNESEHIHVPGIAYDDTFTSSPPSVRETADAILREIKTRWPRGADVLHVHNATLHKNSAFLDVLRILQEHGMRIFIQIHDFAEDGRPYSYYFNDAYLADCHYGVINSRDYRVLLRAGLREEGLHRVFNLVNVLPDAPYDKNAKMVLYPVRGIRRKNIGEALLLSLFLEQGEYIGITLPPTTERDVVVYEGWKDFAANYDLPVAFDVSIGKDYHAVMAESKYVVTTSVNEGFGFTYLEPWTASRFVAGRRLFVCDDFEEAGLDFSHLYDTISIPLSSFNSKAFFSEWFESIDHVARDFHLRKTREDLENGFRHIMKDGTIDFAFLNEHSQMEIIASLVNDASFRENLLERNRGLQRLGKDADNTALIHRNRDAVLAYYNEKNYRDCLCGVYERVCGTDIRQSINKQGLLDLFFSPEFFGLIKWGGVGKGAAE